MKKAKRISKIPPYLFARIDKKKEEIRKQGIDIIDLGVGDPDMPTPNYILKKFHDASNDPKNHDYPPYNGTPDFRKAVADWYLKRFGVKLDPEKEVISLIGSKEGIAHIFFAFVDLGTPALIPNPCYPVYETATLLAGGLPVPIPLLEKNNFLPDIGKIPDKLAKMSSLMFVNYPNNPTGAVADKSFYKDVVSFAKKNDILLCSDLAYSDVTFDDYTAPSILEVKGAKDVAIEFNSLSKSYNMTGWRIGMAVGSKEAIAALSVIKTNIDSGAFKAIQEAAVEALSNEPYSTQKMNAVYSKRMDIFVKGLNELGWDLKKPKGTFYIWARVPAGQTSEEFVTDVLERTGVLVVPGSGYGKFGEGYFRVSITNKENRLREAVQRLKKAGIRFKEKK